MYIYIRSMSEQQNKIYDRLSDKSNQIVLHIIKLILYPDCKYVDHWMHEVWSFLFDVDKLKKSNKWPKSSFIKKAISTHNDNIGGYIELVIDEESDLAPRNIDQDIILNCVENYQSWLADKLSSNGVVLQSDVKIKLKEIIESCDR